MWSTADVMNELRNHRQTCAKIAIIEKHSETSGVSPLPI